MIKRLQRRFILIAMLSMLAVMCVLVGAVNIVNYVRTEHESDDMLALLAQYGGRLPAYGQHQPLPPAAEQGTTPQEEQDTASQTTPQSVSPDGTVPAKPDNYNRKQQIDGVRITPETQFKTRYFTVRYNAQGALMHVNTDNIAAVDAEAAVGYAEEVARGGNEQGRIGIYKYILTKDEMGGTGYIFLDCADQLDARGELLVITLAVAFVSLTAVFLLVSVLSGRAVRPFAESYEKQKRFITDAGHEIKTPLAIISANADVIEMTGGGSEWVTSIKNQTQRLGKLVNSLVTLAKMDEEKPSLQLVDFSLSDAVFDAAAPFETVARCAGKKFELSVEPGLKYHGDEGAIRQLVSVLADNAVKYSDDGGTIRITLNAKGRNAVLDVYNTCRGIDTDKLPHFFDRFYRADDSRSRETGGYGLGLSIAQAVCEAHKAKICARSDDGKSVCFTVTFTG